MTKTAGIATLGGVILASCLCLASAKDAYAESYYFKESGQDSAESALIISRPKHVQDFFGRLDAKSDVDFFSFQAAEGDKIPIKLLVPSGDKDFRPQLIVFGPGLPSPKQDVVIDIGDTNGAIVASDDDKDRTSTLSRYFFTSFFEGQAIQFTAPKSSTYGIAIRTPDGNRGRYVLEMGSEDEWVWSELLDRVYGIMRAILRLY